MLSPLYKDGTIETTKCWKNNLSRILGAVKALSELEKRKRKDQILKDKKVLLSLRRETDNCTTKDIINVLV